ncbi:hypothetical protein CIB84_010143, partial [Bambusicola thoracicus]
GDGRRLKGAIQRSTETGLAVEMPSRTVRQASHESIEDSMNSYGSEGKVIDNTQIYVLESLGAKKPDLELLLQMSNKAALQKLSLGTAYQAVPPPNGVIH